MLTITICACVLAAVEFFIAWSAVDQVACLKSERDEADGEATNWRAAARLHQRAGDLWRARAVAAERRATDAENAVTLALVELDRVDPRPGLREVASVVALPVKSARR